MAVVLTGVHLFGLLLLGFACWRVLGRPELERLEAT
jgi:hypothetical protein